MVLEEVEKEEEGNTRGNGKKRREMRGEEWAFIGRKASPVQER